MYARLFPSFLILSAAGFAVESESSLATMVGVLMDANCAAIRAETAPALLVRVKPVKRTSTRSRTVDSGDKYEKCKATAETSDFAIHTDGKLFLLDATGNDLVRQQVRNESFRANMVDERGTARWLTVTVEGRQTGERLTIVSLRR